MSLYNGAAGVCQMFGFPVPKVPKDIRENMNASVKILKLKSSVHMFKAVHEKVEEGREQQSGSVRCSCLRELSQFIEENDKEKKYAGLHRIVDPYGGGGMWTIVTDKSNIKVKLKDRATKREEEEHRQEQQQPLEYLNKLELRRESPQEKQAEETTECNFCIVCWK